MQINEVPLVRQIYLFVRLLNQPAFGGRMLGIGCHVDGRTGGPGTEQQAILLNNDAIESVGSAALSRKHAGSQ